MAPFFVFGGFVVGLAVVIWVRMLLHDRARPKVVVTTPPVNDARKAAFTEQLAPVLQSAERYTDVDLRRVSLAALHLDGDHQVAIVDALWTHAASSGRESVRLALELRRKAGVRTARPMGLSSARCVACLGPQVEDAGARCSWCGSEMPDAWYLVGLAPYAMAGATRARGHGREQTLARKRGAARDERCVNHRAQCNPSGLQRVGRSFTTLSSTNILSASSISAAPQLSRAPSLRGRSTQPDLRGRAGGR
jgi:hypothetical protein